MDFKGQWVAFSTILGKEVRRFLRIWVQTLVPPVVTMSLYFIIFGKLVGSQIAHIHGFSYMQFIVPGLIMMSVIQNSYANVCTSFFNTKFQRSVEELLVSPTAPSVIILGYLAGGIARGLCVGTIVLCVALSFTEIAVNNYGVLFFFALLTATLFSLGGLANAIFAKKFDDISIVPTFILTPLTYLGGVFYSVEQLPPFWQGLCRANPILYMINGFRYGFLGISDIDVRLAAGILILFCAALFYANLTMLHRGIGLKS